jgi:hypothetical protein
MDSETACTIQMAYFNAGNYHVKDTYEAHCRMRSQMPTTLVKMSQEVIEEMAETVRREEEEAALEVAARSDLEEASQSESEIESVRSAVAGAKHVPKIATLAKDCVDQGRMVKMELAGQVV